MNSEYPTIGYGKDNMTFTRICPKCNRFVKADKSVKFMSNFIDEIKDIKPNATCKKCGRVTMEFIGYY